MQFLTKTCEFNFVQDTLETISGAQSLDEQIKHKKSKIKIKKWGVSVIESSVSVILFCIIVL